MQELILEFFVVHIAPLQILFIYHICVYVFQSEYVPVQSCSFNIISHLNLLVQPLMYARLHSVEEIHNRTFKTYLFTCTNMDK